MTFEEAVSCCHVRSAIYRRGDPVKVCTEDDLDRANPRVRHLYVDQVGKTVPKRYWKNHSVPLHEQVPAEDQLFDDWEEWDPREGDSGSLACFND